LHYQSMQWLHQAQVSDFSSVMHIPNKTIVTAPSSSLIHLA
jgi:hypothetical protein